MLLKELLVKLITLRTKQVPRCVTYTELFVDLIISGSGNRSCTVTNYWSTCMSKFEVWKCRPFFFSWLLWNPYTYFKKTGLSN